MAGFSGGVRYGEIFRRESFSAFLVAGALQFAGPSTAIVVLIFAIPQAYPPHEATSGGAIALALLGLSSALPTLAGAFFSGPLADRHDRHLILRTANVFSLVATAGIAVDLFVRPGGTVILPFPAGVHLPVWIVLLYPGWALLISTATLFRPAYNASIPRFVNAAELGRANGLIYAIAALTSAGGSLFTGVVLAETSAVYAISVPFVLFLATQIALVAVSADLSVAAGAPARRILPAVIEGFRYLYGRRDLFEMTIAALVVNFLAAVALVELGLYVLVWLGVASGFWYGAMIAASTLGAAAGLLAISHVRFEERAGRVLIVLVLAMGFAIVGLALVRSIWLALPIIFLYGLLPGMIQTVFLSSVQATVPDEILGRVFSADEVGSYFLVPFGQAAGGVLTVAIGIQGTFLAAGAAIVGLGGVMVGSFGALRGLGFRPDETAGAASSG